MNITLNPQRRDDTLTVIKSGDTLTINGDVFDFSPLLDGATLPAEAIGCPWISGPVDRINGVIHATLRLPLGANASHAARFPQPIINAPDGVLEMPQ